jgi:acetolactate synthase-1/2/3 large subunit
LQVGKAVEGFLEAESILVTEVSNFVYWSTDFLKQRAPGRWLHSAALFMLGTGMGYALGAKAAFPSSRVVLLSGDGSAGFYPMEFDTAIRHDLPIVVIVGNDAAWGIEQKFQAARFGADRCIATGLLPTRYDRLVAAIGGHGEFVERPEQLGPALERAFASGKPACINVVVDSVLPPTLAEYVATLGPDRGPDRDC